MALHRYILDCIMVILASKMLIEYIYKTTTVSEQVNVLTKRNPTYAQQREDILFTENHKAVGGDIKLTEAERKVNVMLIQAKHTEINASLIHGKPFPPQTSFIKSKYLVEKSDVFRFLRKMPKGAALHLHDCSIVDVDWLVKNVTYRRNCYMCYDVDKSISFMFFDTPPVNAGCPWKLVSEYRVLADDIAAFDTMLYESMVITEDFINKDIGSVWKRFEEILIRAMSLINHTPVFADYFYEALKEFNEDNVQYIEVRALLPEVYELDGSTHDEEYVMNIYKNTTEKFKANYKSFTGAKIIKVNLRFRSTDDILEDIKNSLQLLKQFPDYFAGYDLQGQEDPGKTLIYYSDALQYPSKLTPPVKMPYFFHAGETAWQGTHVDKNMIDAILLNTSRIGHGYALPKHPEAMKLVKERNIAIEVNPISNQVLKLVDDLRNHPAAVLLANGFPVVISSDDPGAWGAQGLTYDFYATFMALAGADDGLQLLKQLAMNSLIYSAMTETEKVEALKDWEIKWNVFVNDILLTF